MNHLPIRIKITLWFALALIVVILLTYICILSVGNQVLQKTIKDNLIETVENNIDEIEYYKDIADIAEPNDVDYFIPYKNGFLEVDDDFLDSVNQVFTALYDSNQLMLYGENPIARSCAGLSFSNMQIQTVKVSAVTYYVFDRELTGYGLDGLWLRGIVAETQGKEELSNISKLSLAILPLILLIAIFGGMLIAKRALSPIQKISDTAVQISRGTDLKKRIELGAGNDELHLLAGQFNNMFARLEDSFEKEKQFTSDVSHELRTPMAVIMAQCEYSMEKDSLPEEYTESIQTIYTQGKKMTTLINQMLDLARLELRPEYYQREKIDLSALVDSICKDLTLIRERGISLESQIEEGISFCGNSLLLSRAIANLILNAYRYGKENGHIVVLLKEDAKQIQLQVVDNGIGISQEDMTKIFDRFYRADRSRTRSGTGLGLAMTREIVAFHQGTISVESTLGAGSRFTIVFQKNND